MSKIAKTPELPYYAVIFTSTLTENNRGYQEMAVKMAELAAQQPGYLGIESARDELGMTISYWQSLVDIQAWKQNSAHQLAQEKGKSQWYETFKVRICKVEKDYGFEK